MKVITTRIPKELITEIRIICVKEGITFQEAIRQGLELWKNDISRLHPHS